MLKLIIDIGNTRGKIHFFDGHDLVVSEVFEGNLSDLVLQKLFADYGTPEAAIVSSVVGRQLPFLPGLATRCRVLKFDSHTPVPVRNSYLTPETLGQDRLAAAVGGGMMYPEDAVLVIEAGTCIKYELVVRCEYLGGIISPGIQMMAKGLHTFTGKLPLVQPDPDLELPLAGNTTTTALLSGIQHVAVAAMEGIIARFVSQYPDLKIVIGGGDMNYFDKRLKYSIFAVRNIVALGLNEILDFNENNTEIWITGDVADDRGTAAQGAVGV
jgi:type III pantothenate kinase